jgi:aminoglycoside phosphotransferase (APT) family kinase protein
VHILRRLVGTWGVLCLGSVAIGFGYLFLFVFWSNACRRVGRRRSRPTDDEQASDVRNLTSCTVASSGGMTTSSDTASQDVKRSSRDPAQLGSSLEAWLATKLPAGANPMVSGLTGTSATGMSSETILFDATWDASGTTCNESLVARIAPDAADCPVFPSYDLQRQFDVIRKVGEITSVPMPRTYWCETDPAVIGSPFFVMERITGEPPPDVMPYNFGDSWLFDAGPDEQRRLQDATIEVIAQLHAIDQPMQRFAFLEFKDDGDTYLRRHVAHARAWYEFATNDVGRCELVERAFAWLDDHWPEPEGATVLSWGDSRIGNVLYRDFLPVAVLDWEMAGLGPRELDIAWLIFAHEIFEHLAKGFGAAGMPQFMRPDDVAATYESLTGHRLANMEFFRVYSAIQYAIVFLRTGFRGVHFGEREMPVAVEDFIYHREPLETMIA